MASLAQQDSELTEFDESHVGGGLRRLSCGTIGFMWW